ncbi:MAG: BatD family protein [Gammaproteobacteria bacterium]
MVIEQVRHYTSGIQAMNHPPSASTPTRTPTRTVFYLTMHLLCWMFSVLSVNAWATLTAEVPKDTFEEGEYITLTIRSDNLMRGSPDFTPLDRDFSIKSTSQQMSLGTGLTPSAVWRLELTTTRTGKVIIPALPMGNEHTTPITITINKSTASTTPFPDFFIEASVDDSTPYILQETLLTLTIYYTVRFDDSELSPLSLPDATVTEIEDVIRGRINKGGKSYNTISLNYVIVPQKAGDMTIDSISLTATLLSAGSRWGLNTKRRKVVRTQPLTLTVRPKPDLFPKNAPWLPAKSVSLSENWSQTKRNITVGEAISRTLTIQMTGQTAHLLPDLNYPELSNAKIYADQSAIEEKTTARGTQSQKSFSYAVVPTQVGAIHLPDYTLYWWNTEQDKLESLLIAGATWQAASSSNPSNEQAQATHQQPPQPASQAAETPKSTDGAQTKSKSEHRSPEADSSNASADHASQDNAGATNWLLFIALIAMTVLWIITFALLLQTRRTVVKISTPLSNKAQRSISKKADLTKAKNEVITAASTQHTADTINALISWARLQFPESPIRGLGDIIACTQGSALHAQLIDLEAQHYQSHNAQRINWPQWVSTFRDYTPQA